MRPGRLALLPLAAASLAATPYVPWDDLTEADLVYSLATRFADLDGRRVHYPTPTAELADALAARSQPLAQRHLAEARLALGDRAGAVAAITAWAEAEGAAAWAEAARWCARHHEWAAAFRAADRALPALPPDARRPLADDAVGWADAHPDAADPLAQRARRAELFPEDAGALEEWIRALETAGRLDEAQAALDASGALPAETRLLIRADLLADHDQQRRAFELVDAALGDGAALFGPAAQRAYTLRVDQGAPGAPEGWRASLERAYDARALVRLATYFQGQRRGDAAADLLRQVERRYEAGFDRAAWLMVSRLWAGIDAVPEAFRARLAAAQQAGADDQLGDLAELARLALRAGGRPLAWGAYNDEHYRWVAPLDRTPGFWTGGLSFLLTGQDWKDALERLSSESLPKRAFRTAQALCDELARGASGHAELPSLRAGLMARHVERGEGRQALELLPLVESGPPEVAAEGRRVALLAMRQVDVPLEDEVRLYRAQLRRAAPDGSAPSMEYRWGDGDWYGPDPKGFARRRGVPRPPAYRNLLDEAVARLDSRDRDHRASLDLLLGEMERLPECEELWLHVAETLEGWRLDDELGPRYERALQRFDGASWWQRAARWYARRRRQADLRRLAEELAARFRGSALFERAEGSTLALEIPEAGGGLRLVPWADYVRLKALERFPHSPRVFAEALGRLVTREELAQGRQVGVSPGTKPVLVDAALREERRFALLFVDPARRDDYLEGLASRGELEARLTAWEAGATRTPVEERLLFDGWARLSRFERATGPVDRLAALYPGDGALARDALALHRSLATLAPGHADAARAIAERTAPALEDPNALWTELGELEQERGRGDAALRTWNKLLEREPRSAQKVDELSALLWDYGYMREALGAVEHARRRLERPRLLAFEAGVLREELKDVEGAVREYLGAAQPDQRDCFCTWFEADQRALRRLSQLLARERVRALVLRRIQALRPGVRDDQRTLVALFPLAQVEMPDDTLDFTADDWIDRMDLPVDPVGREQREGARADWRPRAREGFERVGAALLERTLALLPQGSESAFLDAVAEWQGRLADARWAAAGREVDLEDALRARRAELAPSAEDRVALEVERARFLFEKGRAEAADRLWAALAARVEGLPQGAPRLRAEAERAAYLERSQGASAAAAEWQALAARYPWSRGLLEARLAFLARVGRGADGRGVLEEVLPRAAAGHRETLLARLASEALEARDLPQARRAVEALASEPGLDASQRLGAVHLVARLALRENAGADLLALAKGQEPRFEAPERPFVYAQIAGAADAEKQWAAALTMWIEALNRRLERPWIGSAWRAADRAGRAGALTRFFETQRERSPRDVRWAVAVRELRLLGHDLEGAIQTARAAVDVRPERESLWREASELMVRAGRPRDAADFLDGWAKPRPADEGVAGWRSRLYADAGAADRALAVEQAALEAFARDDRSDEHDERLDERRSRAARRMMEYGLPRQALKLASPTGDARGLGSSPLGWDERADLALRNDLLTSFLRAHGDDSVARTAAALALAERGRPEQKEEALAYLVRQLFPPRGAGRGWGAWSGSAEALGAWWSFGGHANLEPALRAALARRGLASVPGPWGAEPPAALVEDVGELAVGRDALGAPMFREVDVAPLWAAHLVERDDAGALGAFLQPRFAELLDQAAGTAPVRGRCRPAPPRNWTRWLDDRAALETWVRWAAGRPDGLAALEPAFRERRRWDRLWALGACGWSVAPLVAALPEDTRAAWFRMWLRPSPQDPDPVLKARGQTLDHVGTALARLVTGAPGAARDPLVARLRGPRTVGDVLGGDPAWTWPEFTPRPGTNDDRVAGAGADAGRFPGELWGERPGQAWFVIETLARWRAGEATAARVPLEVGERGREGERARLAALLADRLGDEALALELSADYPASAADLERLRAQLERLRAGRGLAPAQAALDAEVRRLQGSLSDASFRQLAGLAEDLGLAPPLEALDPAQPLGSSLLAHLYERYGPAAGARFRAKDPAELRAALGARWSARERSLGPEAVRAWLRELWVNGAAGLPRLGLRRLGGTWPAAADWLESLPRGERAAALDALEALPDVAALEALLDGAGEPRGDVVRLMRARARLLKDDEAGALALLDEALGELRGDAPLTLQPVALAERLEDDDEEAREAPPGEPSEETSEETVRREPAADPVAGRLRAWLRPFKDAQRFAPAVERVRALLAERRAASLSAVPAPSWRLELELVSSEAERAALLQELEHGWVRGDWSPWELLPIVEVLADHAPAQAVAWIARLPRQATFDSASTRARLLARAKDLRGAASTLVEARGAGSWSTIEEVRAFDQWRHVGAPAATAGRVSAVRNEPATRTAADGAAAPATWTAALAFWMRPPDQATSALATHLRQHPFDTLAARAVLRTIAPSDEEPLRLAQATLGSDPGVPGASGSDAQFLAARRARGLLPRSWRAAQAAFAQRDAAALALDLEGRRVRSADVAASLADLARAATPAGDARTAEAALAALELRRPGSLAALRAELRPLRPLPPLRPFELAADGAVRALRPRTLDWPLVAAALAQEVTR